jgi:hypothetical protein
MLAHHVCTWLVIIIYRKSNGWKRLATYLTSIRILSDLLKLQFNRFTRIRLLGMNSPISNKPCRLSGVKKVKSSISHSKPACYIRRGAHGLLSEVDQTSPISILLRNLRRLFRWDDVTALLLGALWSHREVNATFFLREYKIIMTLSRTRWFVILSRRRRFVAAWHCCPR